MRALWRVRAPPCPSLLAADPCQAPVSPGGRPHFPVGPASPRNGFNPPPNQGPDPSLVYRPDMDPEKAKDKGSFRNYEVRTLPGPGPPPTPSSLGGGQHLPLCTPGGPSQGGWSSSPGYAGRGPASLLAAPLACRLARSWTGSSPPTSSCTPIRRWTSSGRRYLAASWAAHPRGPQWDGWTGPGSDPAEPMAMLPPLPALAHPVWGLLLQEDDCPGGCGHAG